MSIFLTALSYFIQMLESFSKKHHIKTVIIINDKKLSTDAVKRVVQHQSPFSKSHVYIEHFTYRETGIPDKRKHSYQPAVIRKLKGDELKDYFETSGMDKLGTDTFGHQYTRYMRELPCFSTEDAMIKPLGFRHGDIVFIQDDDPQTFFFQEYSLTESAIIHLTHFCYPC